MASRPVFIPDSCNGHLVKEKSFEFTWAPGFAEIQKKKNINALHERAYAHGLNKVLEISSKSDEEIGKRLSAFSLKILINGELFPLESVYQGSKKFEHGGPFPNVFHMSPKEAKRYIRNLDLGQIKSFSLDGRDYTIWPQNAFYDWLYIRALAEHSSWINRNVDYDAFTDIEFNPAKQVNCQARAFAEYLSLMRVNKLEKAANDFDYFLSLLQPI